MLTPYHRFRFALPLFVSILRFAKTSQLQILIPACRMPSKTTGSGQRQLSGAVNQEKISFSGRPLDFFDSQERRSTAMVQSQGQSYPASSYGIAAAPISDHRTLYHNLAEVQQWAASSAAGGTFPDIQCDAYQGANFLSDLPMTSVAPLIPEVLPASSSDPFQLPLFQPALFRQPSEPGLDYDNLNTSGIGPTAFSMDFNDENPQGHGFDYPMIHNGEQPNNEIAIPMGTRSHSSASTDGMSYPGHLNILPVASGQGNDCLNIFSNWDDQGSHGTFAPEGDANTWSTSPDVGPAVSPSYSQSSFMPQQLGTPLSMVMTEDTWSTGPMPVDGNLGISSPLSLGEAVNLPLATNYVDDQRFDDFNVTFFIFFSDTQRSTLKATQAFHRTPLSSVDRWPQAQCDTASQAYGSPPSSGFGSSRRSSEGDSLSARKDPLYQAQRGEDGLFHCPIPYPGGCKAEKLKCNYE